VPTLRIDPLNYHRIIITLDLCDSKMMRHGGNKRHILKNDFGQGDSYQWHRPCSQKNTTFFEAFQPLESRNADAR
jgi:hypothetical protein